MPPTGKELERQINTPEAVAVREVESYIEKVEKSTEKTISDNQNAQDDLGAVAGNGTQVVIKPSQSVVLEPEKIILPISERGLVLGLKESIFSGVRWLSEWCLMMIKKYPGRVFYSSTESKTYD